MVIIKTNNYSIFYLNYLVWFKNTLYLVMLCFQIKNNDNFWQKLYLFIKNIINCLADQDLHLKILYFTFSNVSNFINITKFVYLLKLDSKSIICQI